MIERKNVLSSQESKRIAQLLSETFPCYEGEAAYEAVQELMVPDSLLYVLEINGDIQGIIGAQARYELTGWELHPLVIDVKYRRLGYGGLLIRALEQGVREAGGVMMFLGTDDENDRTSLSEGDLYDDLFNRIQTIKNYDQHPYEFYQKMGYQIVGVLPDANGLWKPDIYMAKRLIEYKAK